MLIRQLKTEGRGDIMEFVGTAKLVRYVNKIYLFPGILIHVDSLAEGVVPLVLLVTIVIMRRDNMCEIQTHNTIFELSL